jgi:hypothetical protein
MPVGHCSTLAKPTERDPYRNAVVASLDQFADAGKMVRRAVRP